MTMTNLLEGLTATTSRSEHTAEPPQTPVTIRDMELGAAKGEYYDMSLHMADPCPECGAFRMLVGDYACFGVCQSCI